jgi:FkbM family methyltransferase
MSNLTNFIRGFSKFYFNNRKINILEAGADNGVDTEFFCSNFPNGNIFAFEPDPRRHFTLSNLASKYTNLHYINSALGTNNEDVDFYLSSREDNGGMEVWGSSSILKPKQVLAMHPQIKFSEIPIKVNSRNLDWYMKEKNIDSFNMMWLDMQGYEYEVLCSSPRSTEKCDFIYTEVQLIESYEGNKLYESLRDLLFTRGFVPIVEEMPWTDAGNVLFFRQDLLGSAVSSIKAYAECRSK